EFRGSDQTIERSTSAVRGRAVRESLLPHGRGAGSRRQQTDHSQIETRKRERAMPMITNEVAFIAIAVTDKERARKFYQETLELKPATTAMDGGWVEYELGPVTIGVGCHPNWKPSQPGTGTSVALEVDDFDAAYEKLKKRGVKFEMEKFESPVCWMAVFSDPDVNRLLLQRRKTN